MDTDLDQAAVEIDEIPHEFYWVPSELFSRRLNGEEGIRMAWFKPRG